MGKSEIIATLTVLTLIIIIFIIGTLLFISLFRKRKVMHEREKETIEKQHHLDLLNTQLNSQRQTMQHIGQEIHDSVAQKLTLASIYAQRMQFENKQKENASQLEGINKIINDSLLELRQLSKNLTDNQLQNANLTELIKIECEQVNSTGICKAKIETDELPEISIAAKNSLLRIVQEFIQNSIKHSACKNITINMHATYFVLHMKLEDDGKGFDMEEALHTGAGLNNIRRRIQILNGICNFQSEKGNGTKLDITMPLQTNSAEI
jgi:signal transduction histidine kinase